VSSSKAARTISVVMRRPVRGRSGKPDSVRSNCIGSFGVVPPCCSLRIRSVMAVSEGEPVGVSIDLGELAGVVGEIDVGSHIESMHRFVIACKI
jgi:hypothetical protein